MCMHETRNTWVRTFLLSIPNHWLTTGFHVLTLKWSYVNTHRFYWHKHWIIVEVVLSIAPRKTQTVSSPNAGLEVVATPLILLRNSSQLSNLPWELSHPTLCSIPLKCHFNMVEYKCAVGHLCGVPPKTPAKKRHNDAIQWKHHCIHCRKPMHGEVCGINWND